jgi:3-oxoacyl-[acyl-carrier protein] reductase
MDLGLSGRTVIVTGGAGGLGRRITSRFVAEGADVVVTYHRSREAAERLAAGLTAAGPGRATATPYGLDEPGSARAVVDAALAWTGRVDVLVNNAVHWGTAAPGAYPTLEDTPDDIWVGVVDHNVQGALRLVRAVAPHLRQRGWGRLVHVSSAVVGDGLVGAEYYAAAKAALHGFSRSASFDLGRAGNILSNVVAPGLTRTDTNAAVVDAVGGRYADQAALGRLLDADEVAVPIVFLASAANTGITGEVITVDGGV